MTPMLRLEGISKEYRGRLAVKNLDLSIEEGDIFGIMGPSGAGKSTLLRIVDLLEPPTSGKVVFRGREVTSDGPDAYAHRRQMGFVLQKPSAMNRSVFNNIAYGLELRKVPEAEIRTRVEEHLRLLHLEELQDRNARSLSGGEMQRMCFARSAIVQPDLLLLDEYTANLDPQNVAILESAVRDFVNRGKRAVLIVTHNVFQARRLCNRLAVMIDGEIVESGSTEDVFNHSKSERARAFVSGEMIY